MTGPWGEKDVRRARGVPLLKVLLYVCDFLKEDKDYTPRDPSAGSRRFHVSCSKREFRLLVSGEKWLDELISRDTVNRGGGGAVDLVMYLKGCNFVQAVKVCLDAAESTRT